MNRLTNNSELQTYKDCKRKWWLRYFRKLVRKREPAKQPREIGSVVHATLDKFYGGGMQEDVWEFFRAEAERLQTDFPDQEEDVQQIIEMSRIMLEGYMEWLAETGADVPLEVVAPEATVRVEILPGVDLGGKMDVRVYNKERKAKQFVETKTVGSFDERLKMAHMDEQLYEYHLLELLAGLEDETRTDGAILNMLRRVKRTSRAKPPFYMRHEVWHNEEELRSFYHRTVATIRDMLRDEQRLAAGEMHQQVVYPRPSRDCTWKCDYFDVCPMFDDPRTDAEGYLAVYFVTKDPNERYNQMVKEEG